MYNYPRPLSPAELQDIENRLEFEQLHFDKRLREAQFRKRNSPQATFLAKLLENYLRLHRDHTDDNMRG